MAHQRHDQAADLIATRFQNGAIGLADHVKVRGQPDQVACLASRAECDAQE
jgi:hypothetical protein